jgi:hypothetical protein
VTRCANVRSVRVMLVRDGVKEDAAAAAARKTPVHDLIAGVKTVGTASICRTTTSPQAGSSGAKATCSLKKWLQGKLITPISRKQNPFYYVRAAESEECTTSCSREDG